VIDRFWKLAFAFALYASPAFSHDATNPSGRPAGVPGKATEVSKTITIKMVETPEGDMAFDPPVFEVKVGETLRISLMNAGQLEHEFILATPAEIAEHSAMMMEMPDMRHDEPNAVRLQPGASGEIVWKFGQSDDIAFACLIPGHFEAGMRGHVLPQRE
jgi:uncharacterized cupredoxin-like copper-binding protein